MYYNFDFCTFHLKVEKWLLQVEKQMTQSLKDIIMKAVPQYYEVEFGSWITKWPGQVVLVGNITNNFLDIKYFKTFNIISIWDSTL